MGEFAMLFDPTIFAVPFTWLGVKIGGFEFFGAFGPVSFQDFNLVGF